MSNRFLVLLAATVSLAAGSASAATLRASTRAVPAPSAPQTVAAAPSEASGAYTCNHAVELRSRLERRVCED